MGYSVCLPAVSGTLEVKAMYLLSHPCTSYTSQMWWRKNGGGTQSIFHCPLHGAKWKSSACSLSLTSLLVLHLQVLLYTGGRKTLSPVSLLILSCPQFKCDWPTDKQASCSVQVLMPRLSQALLGCTEKSALDVCAIHTWVHYSPL